jgi:hypothetical protein
MYQPPDADEADKTESPTARLRSPWRSSSLPVKLVAGETTRQDVGRDGVDVIGRVNVPEGVDIDWKYSGLHFVRYLPADENGRRQPEFHQSQLNRDGTFRCFNIRPGEYEGAAMVGKPGDSILFTHQAHRKRSFTAELRLTPEMFVGKSTTDPINLGEILLEPAGPR